MNSSLFTLSFPFQDRFAEQVLTHHENLPELHLSPKPGVLMSKEEWLKAELPKLAESVKDALNASWVQKHCKTHGNIADIDEAGLVFSCLRTPKALEEAMAKN